VDKSTIRQHGPWGILNSEIVYRDAWISVVRDQVLRPDGNPGTYATVQLKSGVCVVGLSPDGMIHMTREFHYAVGRSTIEGVSGGIEPGESPQIAAERELAEEIGLSAAKWRCLGTIDPFTAAIHSTVTLYVAEDLTDVPRNLESTELIEPVSMPLEQALQLVKSGEITHAPTCLILLHLALARS
jgi:ADP-ribose pyrophosphatase